MIMSNMCRPCQKIPSEFWPPSPPSKRSETYKIQSLAGVYLGKENGCELCSLIIKALYPPRLPFLLDGDKSPWKPDPCKVEVKLSRPLDSPADQIIVLAGKSRLAFITALEIPASWRHVSKTKSGTKSDNNPLVINQWIENCRATHPKCAQIRRKYVPKRLLDLEAPDLGKDLRLIETASLNLREPYIQFVALSHRWCTDGTKMLKTVKANIEERKNRIQFCDLPRTFENAVETARSIGSRYLWIDSLCLIQNDDESRDLDLEFGRMGNIYENAYCVDTALSSKDSLSGYSTSPEKHNPMHQFVDLDISGTGVYEGTSLRLLINRLETWESVYHGYYLDDTYMDDPYFLHECNSDWVPLNGRGWTKQEQIMSRRNIFHGHGQIIWQCCESMRTLQAPWIESFNSRNRLHQLQKDVVKNSHLLRQEEILEGFIALIEDYCRRRFTDENDRPWAFAGIAEWLQLAFPDSQYVAGHWTKHLPSSLLWKARRPIGEPSRSDAGPSWAWMSHNTEITHDLGIWHWIDWVFKTPYSAHEATKERRTMIEQRIYPGTDEFRNATNVTKISMRDVNDQEVFIYVTRNIERVTNVPELEWDAHVMPIVKEVECRHELDSSYGATSFASITFMNVHLVPVLTYSAAHIVLGYNCTGGFHMDYEEDLVKDGALFVMRIQRHVHCCHGWVGLVLQQVSEQEQTYQRIGLARCIGPQAFDGISHASVIKLL